MSKHIVDLLGSAEDSARKMARRSGVLGSAAELRLADHYNILLFQQGIAGNVRIALSRVSAPVERAITSKVLAKTRGTEDAVRQLSFACGEIQTAVSGCAAAAHLVNDAIGQDGPRDRYTRTKWLWVTSNNCAAATNALAEGPAWPVNTSSAAMWALVCGYFERMLDAMLATWSNEAVIIGGIYRDWKVPGGDPACSALKAASGYLRRAEARCVAAAADFEGGDPERESRPFAVSGLQGYGS